MTTTSPLVRLGLFAALLALVFGAAFGVGAAGDPVDRRPPTATTTTMGQDHGQHG